MLQTLVVQGQLSGKSLQKVQLQLQLKTGIWKMAEVYQGHEVGGGILSLAIRHWLLRIGSVARTAV